MMNVRLARYDELNHLLDLYRHLNPDDPDISGAENIKSLWKEIFEDPGLFYIVAEEDGQLTASCTLAVIKNLTRGARPYGLIENVVTHQGYRRRGYGKAILNKAVEIAKGKNCYKVMLLTGRKDEGVHRFYEEAGFESGVKTGFIMKL